MSAEYDHDYRMFAPGQEFQGDDKLPVRFYMGAVKDEEASTEAGRPIFRDVECIQIFNSKDNVIDRPVRDTDKNRWPRSYHAWKNSGDGEPGASGTRLEHWPQVTRAQAEELRYFKVFTVEGLAALPDSTVQKIPGALVLKQKAMLYVEAAKADAPFLKMKSELDKRDGEIANLKEQLARLSKIIEEKAAAPA